MPASPQTLNWGDLLATTAANWQGGLNDTITTSTALLERLQRKGNVKSYSGGYEIHVPLEYAFNNSFQWYSGYEYLNTTPNEIMTIARYTPKQASIAVSISGREQRENRGPEQIINLLEAKMSNAKRSAKHYFNQGVYGDGTAAGGKSIQGLAALVSKTPDAGTIGSIDSSTADNVWWRNVAIDAADDAKGAIDETNIQDYMAQMSYALTRGTDSPDLIVFDNKLYDYYRKSLVAIQRITDNDGSGPAGGGFASLVYNAPGGRADVVLDGGRGGQMPEKTGYFLNTDYIYLMQDPGRNWTPVGGERLNTNQDAVVQLLLWMGAFVVSNRSLQGVLFDSTGE